MITRFTTWRPDYSDTHTVECGVLINDFTGTQIVIEYQRRFRKMAWMRVSVNPDDAAGLGRRELESILCAFRPYRLRSLELALDFPSESEMDADFVRRYLKSGKSRLRHRPKYPQAAWLGTARAAKLVRSYPKVPVDGFRIELQLNSKFLEKRGINVPADFLRLVGIAKSQIEFFDVNWSSLSRSVKRHYPQNAGILIKEVRQRSEVLGELLKYLRSIGITNPVRFLIPMDINRTVSAAVRLWAQRWAKG